MSSHHKPRLLGAILAGAVLAASAFGPGPAPSVWAGSKAAGEEKIEYTGETPLFPGYPRAFSAVGRIDRITATEVVIDDSLHRISAAATYHVPRHSNTIQSELHVGDVVGCLYNPDGEIESIWFITRGSR